MRTPTTARPTPRPQTRPGSRQGQQGHRPGSTGSHHRLPSVRVNPNGTPKSPYLGNGQRGLYSLSGVDQSDPNYKYSDAWRYDQSCISHNKKIDKHLRSLGYTRSEEVGPNGLTYVYTPPTPPTPPPSFPYQTPSLDQLASGGSVFLDLFDTSAGHPSTGTSGSPHPQTASGGAGQQPPTNPPAASGAENFHDGEDFEHWVETADGRRIGLLAEVEINGTHIHSKNVCVFPEGQNAPNTSLREMLQMRTQIRNMMREQGFDTARISGEHVPSSTSGNAGQSFDHTYQLP